MARQKISISKELLEDAISKSASMKEASRILDVSYTSFIRYAKSYNLYSPNQGLIGRGKPIRKSSLDLSKILNNEQFCGSSRLKNLLYKQGVKKPQCEKCKIQTWNSERISFHLDHVDGNNQNSKLDNLRILCPNCHSQTPTYCRGQGKSKNKLAFVTQLV